MFRFGCGHVTKDEAIHEASWGARLIYEEVAGGSSGVVWDRQTPDGDADAVRTLFPVIETATAEFRKIRYNLPQDSRGRLCWRDGRVLVVMSPQGSYGYLYITAVLEREGHEGETHLAAFEDKPVPQFGNWPPEVVAEREAAERKRALESIEWAERELKWAQDEVRWAKTPRAATIRQKKADKLSDELYDLRVRAGL